MKMTRPMTLPHVMKKLKAMGTAKTATLYRRHGIEGPAFGVSYAHLNLLRKSIGVNQVLARKLWATGNHDAQVLATMVADPRAFSSSQLNTWAKALGNYVVADAFSRLVRQSRYAKAKAAAWSASGNDWIGQAGWNLVAFLALNDPKLTNTQLARYVEQIAKRIHKSKNRTRYAMNSALIAIGIRNAHLKQKALRAAAQIGTVTVYHGETRCKTPDAEQYIVKSWNRKMA